MHISNALCFNEACRFVVEASHWVAQFFNCLWAHHRIVIISELNFFFLFEMFESGGDPCGSYSESGNNVHKICGT